MRGTNWILPLDNYKLNYPSAQVKTCCIFASLMSPGISTIIEPLKLVIDETKNEKPECIKNYVYKSEPFMSIDVWIDQCDIFIDNSKLVKNILSFVNTTNKLKIVIGVKTDILFECVNILSNINKYFILLTF